MSKLVRRLTFPLGVVWGSSDVEGSGRGDGGGELEVVMDMRGVR